MLDAPVASVRQRIVGGELWDPSQNPAVGFLRARDQVGAPWGQFCSATLVGRHTVITAGHCLANQAKLALVMSDGNLEFALGPDENTVTASSTVIKMFTPADVSNLPDIALAFLADPIGVDPMPLRTDPLQVTGKPDFNWLGETVRIIGYGATEKTATDFVGRGVRRSVELEVVEPTAISPSVKLPNNIPYLVFHADPNNPKGSCYGDSGGPAIHLNPVTNEHEVVAISSGANSTDCIHGSTSSVGATYWYQRTDVQSALLLCDSAAKCSGHGTCWANGICDCDEGYEGDGCSTLIDEDGCAAAPCFPGVACTDAKAPATGYRCGPCPDGYEGDGESCTDVDGRATGDGRGSQAEVPDNTAPDTTSPLPLAADPTERPNTSSNGGPQIAVGSCSLAPNGATGTGAELLCPLLCLAAFLLRRRRRR